MKPQDRTRAILNSVLPSMQRLILIAICDHMGTNDAAFPGLPTVARLAGMSERRTKGHIKAMSDAGILVRRHRPGPQPPIYTVRWEALTGDETSPGTKRHQGRSVPPTRDGASPLTGDGASLRSDQGSDQEATILRRPIPKGVTSEQRIFLERMSPLAKAQRWKWEPVRDLAWFTEKLLPSVQGMDLANSFDQIENWIEGKATKRKPHPITPQGWKNFLSRWLKKDAAKHGGHNGRRHGKTGLPTARRGAWEGSREEPEPTAEELALWEAM